MNVVPLDPALPEALRRQLAALPWFEPAVGLRARVLPQLLARAMPRRAPWIAAASAALLVLAGAWWLQPAAVQPGMSARMASLEAQFAALRVDAGTSVPAAAVALESELARLDRTLQSAYDSRAPRTRVDALWRDREVLLDGLLLAYRQPDRMIRI